MNFRIPISQMEESLVSVIKCRSFEDIGISKSLYKICELIDQNYHEVWNKNINMGFLNYYGFDSLETFKNIYARARLYNAIRFNPQQSIVEYISWHQTKVRLHFDKKVSVKKNNGSFDVLEFLLSMSIDELFCVGW
jgi:hypothetical protein